MQGEGWQNSWTFFQLVSYMVNFGDIKNYQLIILAYSCNGSLHLQQQRSWKYSDKANIQGQLPLNAQKRL